MKRSVACEGSFFLTYHRFATKEQLLRAYPQLPAFLTEKKRIDPRGLFQSDWYRWLQQTVAQCVGRHSQFPKAVT